MPARNAKSLRQLLLAPQTSRSDEASSARRSFSGTATQPRGTFQTVGQKLLPPSRLALS